MQRQAHVDTARLDALRQELSTNLTPVEQQDDPLDRRDRVVPGYYLDAEGVWVPAAIERDDDVHYGGLVLRVIGPSRGRSVVYGYKKDDRFGELVIPMEITRIEARAPANSNAVAMPVVPGYFEPPAPVDLEALRQEAFAKIDVRSQALIGTGFSYRDVVFSASLEAQSRYNGMMSFIDALEYPVGINSLDDTVNLPLENPDDVRLFCATALRHIKGVIDTGSAQKQRVRDMTEPAQLREFTDPR